jgi:3-methyladenine DNA glycosylase AlkD
MLNQLRKEMKAASDPKRAKASKWFFKTGKGDYGEGDIFLGLDNPSMRRIAKKYKGLPLGSVQKLLDSGIHEERQMGLFILVNLFARSDEKRRKELFSFYLKNAKRVNNWDLVDLSAPHIVGESLLPNDRKILYKLAKSDNLWERRIAIISTFAFIRNGEFRDTLAIAEILMNDPHDLIHKAVGWMLREVGKRDQSVLENFLKKHSKHMPRTMLRYAIEKFDPKKRAFYMKK